MLKKTISLFIACLLFSSRVYAEKKAEHVKNKIVIKSKDKTGNWKTEKEIVLMFDNNRRASKKQK